MIPRSLDPSIPSSVCVTGVGVVSPIGIGREPFWRALCDGASGVAPIEGFAPPDGGPRLGAEVRGFAARDFVRSAHLRRMDKLSRFVVAASRLALDDARLDTSDVPAERVGVVVGSAFGNLSETGAHLERLYGKGPAAVSPLIFPNLVMNAPASYVAMELGATGINLTIAQGEISGEQAIILGCDMIRGGRADLVLAGGGDELAPIIMHAYRRARGLSGQAGGREWCSPYDDDRNGIILGEGAAMLVLESSERVRQRGAAAYAEIESTSLWIVPAPRYDWPGSMRTAPAALRALLTATEGEAHVDLICGGANSSRRLDACEIDLFSALLGEAAGETWLTSIKGATGELGAAGALGTAAACLALGAQTVPPLCHLQRPQPGAPFRFAAGRSQPAPIARVLQCGIARGGAAAAIMLRRP